MPSPKKKYPCGHHPNSRKNLVAPWPSGISGNPGGRPKNDVAKELAQAVFEGNKQAIYKAMAKQLLKGNAYGFCQLARRAYGEVPQQIEFTGTLEHRMTLADVRTRIDELLELRKRASA